DVSPALLRVLWSSVAALAIATAAGHSQPGQGSAHEPARSCRRQLALAYHRRNVLFARVRIASRVDARFGSIECRAKHASRHFNGGRLTTNRGETMKPTGTLHDEGQSLWLDNITRDLLNTGTLKRYIDELSVTGLTSNPTIFDHAIKNS